MADKYRTESFSVKHSGAYVQVFQRPGEKPLIECNLFGGNKSIDEIIEMAEAMTQAVELACAWAREDDDSEPVMNRMDLLTRDE